MRIIVGVLSVVYLLATVVLIASLPSPVVIVACLLIAGCIGLVCFGLWRDSFAGLVTAALSSALMAGLASAALLELGLGLWPALARSAGALTALLVLGWASGAWGRSLTVLPIEVAILRDTNTLGLSLVHGPARVLPLPFRELFARLPLLSQELLHRVDRIDVLPHSGALSCQIDAVAVEVTFRLEPARALRIFAAPSWQERVGKVLRASPELRGFLAALKDHGVWQEVFSGVVAQQLELVLRRTVRSLGLEPHALSAQRDLFEERLYHGLRAELAGFGLALDSLDVLQIEIAELAADRQGRALETLAAAELHIREQQLALAIRHIRENGLEESPAMIETVMMLIAGLQGQVALIRSRPAEAEAPLKERSWAA